MKVCALALLMFLAVLPVAAQDTDSQSAAVASAKQVFQQIVAGQFDTVEARYNDSMSAALHPGTLASAWAKLLESAGSFDSVTSANATKSQTFDVVVLVCKFEKGLIDAQIAFGPDGKLAGLHFGPHREPLPPWVAPAYVKPDTFTEQPLTLVNGKYELPGTLTMPKGDGPFPAVVLLQGSGPHDEDETVGPNKPFKDVAWGIASNGIAVFRYTKRTQKYGAQSSDDPQKLTVDDETISDARAAVLLLAKQAKIDSKRIFLVGHSLGAYVEPRIATGDAEIAGIVMLAGNTRPMEQLLVDEIHYVLASTGAAPSADEQKQVAVLEESAKKIESPDLKPGDSITLLGSMMPASYWLDLRDYHPIAVAKELKIPILILQGGRDFQVPPATNFEEWKAALGGQRNVTLKLYPELNHLFIAGTGPSLPQEYEKPGHVDERAIAEIATWVSTGGKTPHLGN
jgi:dienelactone hydrolase